MTERPVLHWLAGGLALAGVLLFAVATATDPSASPPSTSARPAG